MPAAQPDAPTVLIYGHFDVQPPDPLDLWESDPFEPTVRDDWLYARGVADDKGQLYLLLKAAQLLAQDGGLPVNLRVACDGEEEIGGHSIVEYLEADERGADAAIIFDAGMIRRGVPAFFTATRGLAYFHVRVCTGARDLHSGLYGGAALNATHALMQTLQAVLPRDGRLPEPLRAGAAAPTEQELADWSALPAGAEELTFQGARPADPKAAEEFYLRTFAEPSVDVHGLEGGSPQLQKTVLPVVAEANLSIRLAPGQQVDVVAAEVERLLREAAPEGAELEIECRSSAAARAHSARRAPDPARPRRVRACARRRARCCSARAERCRSSPRSSRPGSRRSSRASRCPSRTSTRRTSGCWSSTSRWASPPRGSSTSASARSDERLARRATRARTAASRR